MLSIQRSEDAVLIHPITHLMSSDLVSQSDLTVCKQTFTTLYL